MNKEKTKIVFFGTSDFSKEILEGLNRVKYNITAVITQPDKKTGREQTIMLK